jgi:ABC-type xylose transport system permease subunit
MIVTLGGLFFYRGLVYVSTHGGVSGPPRETRLDWFNQPLGEHWFRVENGFLLLLLIALLSGVLLYHMPFGSHLLALGGNPASAESQIHRIADRIVILENGRKVADVRRDAMSAEELEEIIRHGGVGPTTSSHR